MHIPPAEVRAHAGYIHNLPPQLLCCNSLFFLFEPNPTPGQKKTVTWMQVDKSACPFINNSLTANPLATYGVEALLD